MVLYPLNWLAFVVGTAFTMVLGFLWYGPFFAKPWLAMMEKAGRKREDMQSGSALYLLAVLGAAVSSYVLAVLVRNLGATEWWQGLVWGVVVWVGAGAATSLNSSIFESRRKSLWLLYGCYQLVVYGALGVLFATWR